MTKDKLTYLCFSDVHLGHPNTPTTHIIANLKKALALYEHRFDIDLFFIAGDLFDRLLTTPSDEYSESLLFMGDLISFCERKDIKLRILEGTPSHDWKQSRQIYSIKQVRKEFACDVKYIDTLHIEHIEDLGIHVLYIPDEYQPSTEKTLEDVKALMSQQGLTRVDLAMMHGHFNFQLPPAAKKAPRHDESEYLKLVNYFINIGHDHSFAVFDRIIAQGSFDRLTHGEEEPKGFVECCLHRDGKCEFFFIENKEAQTYLTLKITQKNVEEALKLIHKKATALRANSFIRIKAEKNHPIYARLDEIKKTYPLLTFTRSGEEEETIVDDIITDIETVYIPILLTRDNIEGLLIDHLKDKHTLDEHKCDNLRALLKEALC